MSGPFAGNKSSLEMNHNEDNMVDNEQILAEILAGNGLLLA